MVVEVACDMGESGDAESGGKRPSDSASSVWSTASYLTAMVMEAACDKGPAAMGGFSTAWTGSCCLLSRQCVANHRE
jgi:hypothetical protein